MHRPSDQPVDVYVGLGSNEGDRAAAFALALGALGRVEDTRVVAVSPVYEGEAHVPEGEPPQPDHLNAVARLSTCLPPAELLGHLQRIEREAGREPGPKWAPRPLDLDLLLYGEEAIRYHTPYASLTVPHPQMGERRFVLAPLADLAPDLVVPEHGGATVADLLARCPDTARLARTDVALPA